MQNRRDNIVIHASGRIGLIVTSDVTAGEMMSLPNEIGALWINSDVELSIMATISIPRHVKTIVFHGSPGFIIPQRYIDLLPWHLQIYKGSTCVRPPIQSPVTFFAQGLKKRSADDEMVDFEHALKKSLVIEDQATPLTPPEPMKL